MKKEMENEKKEAVLPTEAEAPVQEPAADREETDGFLDHIRGLQEQARKLAEKFPGLQLEVELQDPRFARLTAPGMGLTVEDAYFAIHRQEIQAAIMEAAVKKAAEQITDSIRSGALRPAENGASGTGGVLHFDYRSMDPGQRGALKQRILRAAARGEKLYPGM